MRRPRRGYLLSDLLCLLPLIAVLMTVGYQVANRAIRYQAQVTQRMDVHARMADVVRRLQIDIGRASDARVITSTANSPAMLRITLPAAAGEAASTGPTTVEYIVSGETVQRIEHHQAAPVCYEWLLRNTRTGFTLETVSGGGNVVWVTFDAELAQMQGPPLQQRTAAAMALSGGGRS